jgi:uncharacterized protein
MLYIAICKDNPVDGLVRRKETRPRHLAYLEGFGDKVRAGGALLSEDGTEPRGSVVIIEAESLEAARVAFAGDPYAQAGVFASIEIYPLKQAVGAVQLG